MSWAELKKFINSGKVPLNELLEPVDAVENFTVTGSASNEMQTVLNITGSGRLHCVGVTNRTESNSRIIITVDGAVVCDVSVSCSDTEYKKNALYIGRLDEVGVDNGKYVITPFFTLSSSAYATPLCRRITVPLKSEAQSYSPSDSTLVTVALTAPIRFKESLVIQVKGTSTTDSFGILYDLG